MPDRVRGLVPVPGVLPGLSLSSGQRAVSEDRRHQDALPEHLGTHTLLAAAVPVLAIVTLRRGLAARFDSHRRIAR